MDLAGHEAFSKGKRGCEEMITIFSQPSLAWMILISVNLTYHAEIIYIKSFADNAEERSVKHGPVDF